MRKTNVNRFSVLTTFAALAIAPGAAHALEGIVRPFQTTRAMSMGGVKILTGVDDENFYGNPARAAAILGPEAKWKMQILEFYPEANGTSIKNLPTFLSSSGGGNDFLNKLSSTSGEINHVRMGMTLLGLHIPTETMAFSFGINLSVQSDVDIRRSYQVDPQTVADIGPTLLVARKFLEEDALSVGIGLHFAERVSTRSGFTFVDLLQGQSLSPLQGGGEGAHFDFDIGGTYKLPWKPFEFDLEAGATISNVIGGEHKMMRLGLVTGGGATPPLPSNRLFALGVSARKPQLWEFTDFVLALEASDIGAKNGSFWKWIHLGAEGKWKLISVRLGFNQGYFAGGLGFDFTNVKLDVGTWGEEYSLNAGGFENRIFGARLGFQI